MDELKTYNMRNVRRKRLTIEIEVELRRGVTRANLLETIRYGMEAAFPGVPRQAQIVGEEIVYLGKKKG